MNPTFSILAFLFGGAMFVLLHASQEVISLPKFVVATIFKNEEDILDYWIEYHTSIFGVDNVIVLDNFSDNPVAISVLQKWQGKGVHVLYEQGPFPDKGKLWLAAARKFRPDAEIYIPLDMDEFVTAYRNATPVVDVSSLLNSLREFGEAKNTSTLALQYYDHTQHRTVNDTVKNIDGFFHIKYSSGVCKKIFKAKQLVRVDQGNHRGTVSSGKMNVSETVGLIHYHFRGIELLFDRALAVLKGRGLLPLNTTLQNVTHYAAEVDELLKKPVISKHKIGQVKNYIDNNGVLEKCFAAGHNRKPQYTFLPLPKIIEKVHEQMKNITLVIT